MLKEYKSWYDLSYEKAEALEKEFLKNDMGRNANEAMHLCVITGVMILILCSIIMAVTMFNGMINPYLFVIMLLFVLLGISIVVSSTIEYHIKFNSWLKNSKRIIKK